MALQQNLSFGTFIFINVLQSLFVWDVSVCVRRVVFVAFQIHVLFQSLVSQSFVGISMRCNKDDFTLYCGILQTLLMAIVHTKNDNSVIIHSPSCHCKPLCTQKKIFWGMFAVKLFWSPLTSIVFFIHTMQVYGLVNNILQNIILCAQQKKEIHTGL